MSGPHTRSPIQTEVEGPLHGRCKGDHHCRVREISDLAMGSEEEWIGLRSFPSFSLVLQ
jgi:hypothetical protein